MRRIVALSICLFIASGMAIQAAGPDTALPAGHTWEYTFADPTGDASWNTVTGLGGGWVSGPAPFSNVGGGDFGMGTLWPPEAPVTDDLWVRTTIDLTGYDLTSVTWDLGVDNGFKLYSNAVVSQRFSTLFEQIQLIA